MARSRALWQSGGIDRLAAGAALCAVPLSIAISEAFLTIALCASLTRGLPYRTGLRLPRVFWFWLVWAVLEIAAWLHSPDLAAGKGELRHLLVAAALFMVLSAFDGAADKLRVWQGIFVTATLGSVALISGFVSRAIRYRHVLAVGGDPGFYLRSGGLLHHWMIYATVEVMVFGALLEFRASYRGTRRWATFALAVNSLAILLSLTRSLWLGCLLLLGLHLAGRRSRWAWALPALPAVAFLIAPGPVRHRMADSFQPDYYSNAERIQMLQVGGRMIRRQPLWGVGPGRVEGQYTSYLSAGDPVPAYHGHLHNNGLQLAAQFGIPTACAALLCIVTLFADLWRAERRAADRDQRFVLRSGLLALTGFLFVGLTDYTYGHSLGLILVMFATVTPLISNQMLQQPRRAGVYECVTRAAVR